jgi:Mn2+/Fe2+ NRAMP family transporter
MKKTPKNKSAFWGASFLMATSAIGPGFLTQTIVFTDKLFASFGFVILVSILLDIGVQLNIWRIITGIKKPAQEIADGLLPGLGKLLSVLILFGGFAFNIGNIAGAGLGLEVITGMDTRYGALLSGLASIWLLLSKNAVLAMDRFVKILGLLMIGLTLYVAIISKPPLPEAVYRTFWPEVINWKAVITIVGGTVGGYICFAGAHRLLEANISEENKMKNVSRAAINGILTASAMRILLFLAALGVVSKGVLLDAANPAADVFRKSAGESGFRLFGIVMWSASVTSVIGSAYTSISFIRSFHPWLGKNQRLLLSGFIGISTLVFLFVGNPVNLLLLAGMINGFILPVSLFILLAAVYKNKSAGSYQHPRWLSITGMLIALALTIIAVQVLSEAHL